MWFSGWIDSDRAVMQTQFADHATFDKRMERLVNSGQRDTGNLLPDNIVNFFWAWMAGSRHQRLVDDGTLVRDGKAVTTTEFTKVSLAVRMHLLNSMRQGW